MSPSGERSSTVRKRNKIFTGGKNLIRGTKGLNNEAKANLQREKEMTFDNNNKRKERSHAYLQDSELGPQPQLQLTSS